MRVLLLGSALLLCGSRFAAAEAPAGRTSGAPPCARFLRAVDSDGRPVWQSIAVALPLEGRAAAPLHLLERGGRRYERLELSDGRDGWLAVAPRATTLADANLALLEVPGIPACGADGTIGDTGSGLQVVRERVGYTSGLIGARVERRLGIGPGREIYLLRLLDERGADPGLVFDATGRFLGATLPAPPAARGSLAVLAPVPDDIPEITAGSRAAAVTAGTAPPDAALPGGLPATRPSPSVTDTAAGFVARALLDGGPGAAERGIDLLGDAMRAAGPSASLLLERGVREFSAGRIAPAIDDFRAAAALDPHSYLARYNLGVALGSSGAYADAAAALSAARDLSPDNGRARYQLVLALSAAHRTDEARTEYRALLALDPTLAQDLVSLPGL
ncbi:MAG TPA: tetratricopeptide repeat protein [Dongiaceae bacterium]|nr:tetratricopeptide repeat protein [Dongiaceae bacterium]